MQHLTLHKNGDQARFKLETVIANCEWTCATWVMISGLLPWRWKVQHKLMRLLCLCLSFHFLVVESVNLCWVQLNKSGVVEWFNSYASSVNGCRKIIQSLSRFIWLLRGPRLLTMPNILRGLSAIENSPEKKRTSPQYQIQFLFVHVWG